MEPRPASVSDDVGGYNAERAFRRAKHQRRASVTSSETSDDVGGYNAERAFRRGKCQRRGSVTFSETSQPTYQRSNTPESTLLSSSDSSSDSSDLSITNLRAFIVDSPDEDSSATDDDEDFEHDFEVIKKINSMTVCTTTSFIVFTSLHGTLCKNGFSI